MLTRSVQAAVVTLLLALMALQLVLLSRATSSTWDEPHHLYDGYRIWKLSDYRLNAEVPPLVKLVAALPLLRAQLTVPESEGRSQPNDAFRAGRSFVFGNGGDRVLVPARMACMGFTLLLGVLIFFMGRAMFGPAAAIFALALFVFDPNFLAHGALVTTDVGISCMFLAAVYAWYRYLEAPGVSRLLLVALAAGLAAVVKFTGLLVVPLLCLIAVADAVRLSDARRLGRRMAALAAASLCAWVLLWAFYGFRYKAAPAGGESRPPLASYLLRVPSRSDAQALALLSRMHALPEAYLWGLANTKITEDQDTSYFFGHVYRHGSWMYFPAAFAIKSTLPLLLLVALVPVAWRRRDWSARGWSQRMLPALCLLLPVAFYLFVVMRSSMNIGMRHLLPIYPFLYILAGGTAWMLVQRSRRWAPVLAALLVWQAATSLRSAPGYMAYANEAWGGPAKVHLYLSDANADWGQQLKDVKRYLDQRGIRDCWFAYFPDSAIEPADYGIPCKRLPTTNTLWWVKLPMSVPPVIAGTVLISDGDLEGIEFGEGRLNPYESFRSLRPAAVIDHGVFVYQGRFAVPLAAALVRAQHAEDLLAAGGAASGPATALVDQAMALAGQALALAPDSAHAQEALGDALARADQPQEAAVHYGAALTAAETIEPSLQADLVPGLEQKLATLAAEGKRTPVAERK